MSMRVDGWALHCLQHTLLPPISFGVRLTYLGSRRWRCSRTVVSQCELHTHPSVNTRRTHGASIAHTAARSRVLRGAPSLCHRVDRQHGGRGTRYAAAANAAVHLACGPWIRARLCDGCAIEPSAGQPRQRLPAATRGYTHIACSGTMCSYDHRPLLDATSRRGFQGIAGGWELVEREEPCVSLVVSEGGLCLTI